ncbi:glycosyltransferase [Clostridiaceae bacterium DONG20-135]|uniref:Glycosyltransferase n=1 Tax=Copranaerobaculum intestinale TaxID=2692629 RepID=A0A6N8UB69_9FIRM|nr:glycosyltransferase family 2 protein [Copranaerobaculum intestinale]MXQ72987.1 glycosyltransferase [Copranaerobaculum intestinale]
MDISIVIPVKNGGEKFKKCLAMIKNQKTSLTYEVICVDSGSKDDSIAVIKEYGYTLYEIPAAEFGHGKTRNFGASKGSGQFIVFITQDAIPAHENWLENLVRPMYLDKDIVGGFGAHYPDFENCNVFEIRNITECFRQFGDQTNIISLDDQSAFLKNDAYRGYISFFSDNNSCVRKSIFEIYPYDDVNFAEDQIWMRKMMEKGYKKVFCYDAPVIHSHNYPLKEYFTRCYDEYKGLYNIQQYRIARSVPELLKEYLKICWYELNYVRHSELSISEKIKNIIYMFIRNYFKFKAGYLGGKYHLLDEDKQIKLDRKFSQQFKQRNS